MKILSLKALVLLLSAGIALAPPAFAAANITIENRVEQQLVLLVDGREQVTYVPTQTTAPGNILRFILAYRNTGDEAARDVVLNNPIPEGTAYLNGSATNTENAQVEFSIDDGKSYKKPALLTYEITLPNGGKETRIASPEYYTHIRWRLAAVPAGAGGEVFFEVSVK